MKNLEPSENRIVRVGRPQRSTGAEMWLRSGQMSHDIQTLI